MADAVEHGGGRGRARVKRLSAATALALAAAAFGVACEPADCTTSWTGPTTGTWSTAANWDAGAPDATDIACLPAGTNVTVTEDADVTGLKAHGRLTIADGATLQVANGAIDAGATTLVDVEADATLRIGGGDGTLTLYGGTLTGAGLVEANVEGAGRIEPGDPDVAGSRGLLTVDGTGDLTGTTIETDLAGDGMGEGLGHDRLELLGTASLDLTTTLDIVAAPGYLPPPMAEINPLGHAPSVWEEATMNLPDMAGSGRGVHVSILWYGVVLHTTHCDPAVFHPGADLAGAAMAGFDLRWCSFPGSDLSGADLSGATLRDANLSGSDLGGADLHLVSASYSNLAGADLSSAELSSASLRYANLSNATFTGSSVTNVDMLGTTVTGAQLAGVTGTGLWATSLNGTPASLPGPAWRMVGAHLLGPSARAYSINVDGADLSGLDLTGAILSNVSMQNADLTDATVTNANLWSSNLTGATLTGVRSGGVLGAPLAGLPAGWSLTSGYLIGPGADLTGASLTGADLSNRTLTGIDLTDATLTDVDVTNTGLGGAVITGLRSSGLVGTPATLPTSAAVRHARIVGPGVDLSGVIISGVDLVAMDLTGADLSGATLSDGDLRFLNLTGANLAGATFSNVWVDGMAMPLAQMGPIPIGGTFGTNLRFAAIQSMTPPAGWMYPFYPGPPPIGAGFTLTRVG